MKIDQAKLLSKQLDQVSRARVVYLLADLMYFVFPMFQSQCTNQTWNKPSGDKWCFNQYKAPQYAAVLVWWVSAFHPKQYKSAWFQKSTSQKNLGGKRQPINHLPQTSQKWDFWALDTTFLLSFAFCYTHTYTKQNKIKNEPQEKHIRFRTGWSLMEWRSTSLNLPFPLPLRP